MNTETNVAASSEERGTVPGVSWVLVAKISLYGIGSMAASITRSSDMHDSITVHLRVLVVICLFLSFLVHLYIQRSINDTYTSFKSGVEYGLSNVEKVASRMASRDTFRMICIINALLVVLHLYFGEMWPCCFSPVFMVTCFLDNNDYVSIFTKGRIKRRPVGFPRSTSGRLI